MIQNQALITLLRFGCDRCFCLDSRLFPQSVCAAPGKIFFTFTSITHSFSQLHYVRRIFFLFVHDVSRMIRNHQSCTSRFLCHSATFREVGKAAVPNDFSPSSKLRNECHRSRNTF
ncbi:hypothetical protein XENORESO_003816 [Xenotaenia resolanae]|uniref:Secreted protein n=1 Tax=Xenotaenia resolanae TaxID=208358 RepID=A0ABV0WE86_9TELE